MPSINLSDETILNIIEICYIAADALKNTPKKVAAVRTKMDLETIADVRDIFYALQETNY